MSWDDGTYNNGACGECQECGEPTAEEWHAYCSDCYAEQNGWKKRGESPVFSPRKVPRLAVSPTEPRSVDQLREEVARLEKHIHAIDALAAGLLRRVEALELIRRAAA